MQESPSIGLVPMLFAFALIALMLVSNWKLFTKAGKPGWAALIPIYNVLVMLEIVRKPAWWLLLLIIPVVQIVPAVLLPIWIARSFGKGTGFGIGLLLLGPIFLPILAFGDAKYDPRGAEDAPAALPA